MGHARTLYLTLSEKKMAHEQTLRRLGYPDEIVRLTGDDVPHDARGPHRRGGDRLVRRCYAGQ